MLPQWRGGVALYLVKDVRKFPTPGVRHRKNNHKNTGGFFHWKKIPIGTVIKPSVSIPQYKLNEQKQTKHKRRKALPYGDGDST